MASIANILPQVWTAITTQLSSFLGEAQRFPREFLFPSLGLLLVMLAIAMDIVGPEAPFAWWSSLALGMQLLVSALLVIALVLIAALSQLFIRTIRALYNGELPEWQWLQTKRQSYYLDLYRQDQNNQTVLRRLQAELNKILKGLTPKPNKQNYDVLKKPLGPYQPIKAENIESRACEPTADVFENLPEPILLYAIADIAAGKPILKTAVRPFSDVKYFDAARQILALPIPSGAVALRPGMTIQLYLARTASLQHVYCFEDIFVLDIKDATQVILAVDKEALKQILALLPYCDATFGYSPFAAPPVAEDKPKGRDSSRTAGTDTTQAVSDVASGSTLTKTQTPEENAAAIPSNSAKNSVLDADWESQLKQISAKLDAAQKNFDSVESDYSPAKFRDMVYLDELNESSFNNLVTKLGEMQSTLQDAKTLLDNLKVPEQAKQQVAELKSRLGRLTNNFRATVEVRRDWIAQRYVAPNYMLPKDLVAVRGTRLGNILAAMFEYPERTYGIDLAATLPKLLSVVSAKDASVARLQEAETNLNMFLLFSFWGAVVSILGSLVLFSFGHSWWFFVLVLFGGVFVWWLSLKAAETQALVYGEALKLFIDLKRLELIKALGIEIEGDKLSLEQERQYWTALGQLWNFGKTSPELPSLAGDLSKATASKEESVK